MESGLMTSLEAASRWTDRNELWGYAATFGATWAAVEVTVGSFAHAIKLPLAGVVLAGVGAALLVALRTLYPKRGVVFAAGIVCAGVKLLSPAGAVLGPMIAILVEAAVAEIVLLPFGAGILSAPLVGILACWYAVTQKLLTQWLLFGAPVVEIYRGILQRAESWMSLPAQGGLSVALVFLLAVGAIGALLGATGLRVGRVARLHLRGAVP
jgi:hypothetical protein